MLVGFFLAPVFILFSHAGSYGPKVECTSSRLFGPAGMKVSCGADVSGIFLAESRVQSSEGGFHRYFGFMYLGVGRVEAPGGSNAQGFYWAESCPESLFMEIRPNGLDILDDHHI